MRDCRSLLFGVFGRLFRVPEVGRGSYFKDTLISCGVFLLIGLGLIYVALLFLADFVLDIGHFALGVSTSSFLVLSTILFIICIIFRLRRTWLLGTLCVLASLTSFGNRMADPTLLLSLQDLVPLLSGILFFHYVQSSWKLLYLVLLVLYYGILLLYSILYVGLIKDGGAFLNPDLVGTLSVSPTQQIFIFLFNVFLICGAALIVYPLVWIPASLLNQLELLVRDLAYCVETLDFSTSDVIRKLVGRGNRASEDETGKMVKKVVKYLEMYRQVIPPQMLKRHRRATTGGVASPGLKGTLRGATIVPLVSGVVSGESSPQNLSPRGPKVGDEEYLSDDEADRGGGDYDSDSDDEDEFGELDERLNAIKFGRVESTNCTIVCVQLANMFEEEFDRFSGRSSSLDFKTKLIRGVVEIVSRVAVEFKGDVVSMTESKVYVAFNLYQSVAAHAQAACGFTRRVETEIRRYNEDHLSDSLNFVSFSIGVATGDVFHGFLGSSDQKVERVFGDTKKISSLLSDYGLETDNRMILSHETSQLVNKDYLVVQKDVLFLPRLPSMRNIDFRVYELVGRARQLTKTEWMARMMQESEVPPLDVVNECWDLFHQNQLQECVDRLEEVGFEQEELHRVAKSLIDAGKSYEEFSQEGRERLTFFSTSIVPLFRKRLL